ncbi:MAG TPA: DUF3140 domain-containing protein [Allosphingosinicella sp.]|nr:DUF3140 domain-containing protein [Allosphingosinicella sp.]
MAALDKDKVYRDFSRAVNMAATELEEWLESEQSREVGWKADGRSESIGHASGRRIVALLRANKADLTEEDYAHMRKVVGYVARHGAQRPENVVTSRWRYSLMNWGHDPLKEEGV